MEKIDIIDTENTPQLMTHDGKLINLELKQTKYAESRFHDIQTANPGNLQELATVFLAGCHEINKALSFISNQLSLVKHKKDIIYSQILIQKVPFLLEQTKQRSSEDVRTALIEMDTEYQSIKQLSALLENAFNSLKDKRKVVEMAYFSCQKIAEFKAIYQPTGSHTYSNHDAIQAGSEASWA